jgi:microcystin-dependent protein
LSNYSKIVNYAAKDTLVEGDPNKIIRGTEIDVEFSAVQTAVATKADIQSPNLTGVPRAPTASFGTNTTQVATTAFVQQNSVPVGGIIMWSGLVANIPQGYALCNGSNGTPDLRDKFIIGAGSTYAPAATGGSSTVTLIEANLPAHSHSLTGASAAAAGGHTHSVSDAGHYHSGSFTNVGTPVSGGLTGTPSGDWAPANTNVGNAVLSVSSVPNHTHDLSGSTTSVGSGTAVNILPPYVALAYIMRTA